MRHQSPYHRPALAAVVAGLLMLLFGWGYRTLATQLRASPTEIRIASDALEKVPMRIADWVGEDIPMDETIVRKTGTDAHINRRYSRGIESVSLYVGCGARARDLMPHRPEACYIGAGWTLTSQSLRDLPLSTSSVLPCRVLEFSRGALNTDRIMIVHYYIVDGHYCQNLADWRYRFWQVADVAQVQIIASVKESMTADEAARIVCDFAIDSAPSIAERFGDIVMRKDAGSSRKLDE